MIRSYAVTVSVQAGYDEYLQRQVAHYQDYVAGSADRIGHDMEVAEAPTQVTGDPAAAARIGLAVGGTPSASAITRVGCGCNAETGTPVGIRTLSLDGERTAYQDLVFSVPKSVSVEFAAARAAGDEARAQQLIGAMTESVEEAIGHIQQLVPLGRRRVDEQGIQVAMPARVVALMDVHSASRPVAGQTSGDPQLHVHTRLINLGLQPDGKVASVNYWMLYQNIRPLNGLFEAGLRSRLETMGYPTVDARHGERRTWSSFELERQDEKLSARLSSRQERIEGLAEAEYERRSSELLASLQITAAVRGGMGVPGPPVAALTQRQRALCKPTAREVAVLSRASREQKLARTRADLAQEWGQVIGQHGYRHKPSEPPPPSCRSSRRRREREMVRIARAALGPEGLVAGRSVFDRSDILEFVSSRAVERRLDAGEFRRVVDRIEARAVRLPATVHEHMGAFTTREQLAVERDVVEAAAEMADEATVGVPIELVTQAIEIEVRNSGGGIDGEQAAAVRAFCSPSGWVQLVGVAGSGKTTVCRPAVAALQAAGYQVLGVSLSQGATDVLAGETGIPSWNLADFVTRVEHSQLRSRDGAAVSLTPRTIVLVDEAGTVDSGRWRDFTKLCLHAGIAGVRVLGDPEQTQPVGSGSVLGWLSRHLPTTYLTANYRQGEGTEEADNVQLLRDGRGVEFLIRKDRAGQLWIDADPEVSVGRAAETWARAIAGGGDPRQHVLLADLVDVAGQLNRRARAEFDGLGRLGEERVTIGGREWAVGDRVVFALPYKFTVPMLADDGSVARRHDGGPRERTTRTPRRTQGDVVAIGHAADGTPWLRIETDARGRLPSRLVDLDANNVAQRLDYGYAMTTTVAQARTWEATYRVMTASRLTGRQQEYVGGSRHLACSQIFGDLRSVFAEPDQDLTAREDAIVKYGALISRDVAKVSTLDYLSAEDRSALEYRLAPRYLRAPSLALKAPISERQTEYLQGLGRTPEPSWSWVRASVEIDGALGHPPGGMAMTWLRDQGVADRVTWRAVDRACQEAGRPNPHLEPAAERPQHLTPEWDTATALDAARADRGGRDLLIAARQADISRTVQGAPQASAPAGAAMPEPAEPQRPAAATVTSPKTPRPRRPAAKDAPVWKPDPSQPQRARAPKPMDDEERRRRDQLARESAEREQQARERGPHES